MCVDSMNILDIKLTYKCNNHCLLCCQDDKIKNDKSTIVVSNIIAHIKSMTFNEICNTKVVLTGGEPTLHPDILRIIEIFKNKGFAAIQLQTNLTLKTLLINVNDLVKAGITSFGVSLHGCNREMHENFTGTKESFVNTFNNLVKLSKLRIPVVLNCVISKYNLNSLSEIVAFVAKNHLADSIQFAFIHITGRAEQHHELVPTISSAAKEVQNAITLGNQLGIVVKSEAIPFCMMRGFERNIAELEQLNNIIVLDKKGAMHFSRHREECLKTKAKACEQCLFYSMCEGPWVEYPQLFGWKEFVPVRRVRPYE